MRCFRYSLPPDMSESPSNGKAFTDTYSLQGRSPASPGRSEILAALETAPKIQNSPFTAVAQISSTLVVKYGLSVQMGEARTMMLATTITGVRLPQVYDAWEEDEKADQMLFDNRRRITYILMDFISGSCLGNIWQYLEATQRETILQDIHRMLKALHQKSVSIPGPIGGGKCKGFYFTNNNAGPFNSQHDMEQWFNARLKVCKQWGRANPDQPSFTGCFEPLVLCHLDLHSYNIIIDQKEQAWLIDWDKQARIRTTSRKHS